MAASTPLRVTFARLCRDTRITLDVTQQELADAAGVSRASIASIESGRANPSIDVVERIAEALGLELELLGRPPIVLNSPRQHDLVHARCSGHVDRRFSGQSWPTCREVTIGRGRTRGWIDLLAFDPRRRLLVIVEIKTWIDDLGAIERQLDWYLREAPTVARELGWRPIRTIGWVLALASDEVDDAIRRNRVALSRSFPGRAASMRELLAGDGSSAATRGIALIDPRSRRRDWLMPSRVDGRRSVAPYRDYADALRLMSG